MNRVPTGKAMIAIGDYEIGEAKAQGAEITFSVSKVDGSRNDREGLKRVDELLKHLGRWERLVNGISLLLGEISVGRGRHYDEPFGYERYAVKTALAEDGSIGVTVCLSKGEELVRERNGGPKLGPAEVDRQLQALSKWIAFIQSVRSVPLF